ncbi:MAG: hypothetical protein V2A73_05315 [Pseudomonadota bacterium]
MDFIQQQCFPSGRCQFEETASPFGSARFCFCSGHQIEWWIHIPNVGDDQTEPFTVADYDFFDPDDNPCLHAVWDYTSDVPNAVEILFCPPEAYAWGNCIPRHIEVSVTAPHELEVRCPGQDVETWSGEDADRLLRCAQPWLDCSSGGCALKSAADGD